MLGDIGKGGFMSNAYNEFIEFIGSVQQVEPSFFIAKVTSPLPNLKVQLNDIILDEDDLLIDKWLKDRNGKLFTEDVEAHTHTSEHPISSENKHKHEIKEPIHDKLKVDDQVVLLKINDKFIIISKVVKI